MLVLKLWQLRTSNGKPYHIFTRWSFNQIVIARSWYFRRRQVSWQQTCLFLIIKWQTEPVHSVPLSKQYLVRVVLLIMYTKYRDVFYIFFYSTLDCFECNPVFKMHLGYLSYIQGPDLSPGPDVAYLSCRSCEFLLCTGQ